MHEPISGTVVKVDLSNYPATYGAFSVSVPIDLILSILYYRNPLSFEPWNLRQEDQLRIHISDIQKLPLALEHIDYNHSFLVSLWRLL